ncbi:hypothetical protein NIIDNTM18_07980 [Mycolicibacterium litorale]|uniref:ER-bound oxygenase mpaB/mpaB'/Rubber oxygenase catalytic domain-containing protein n=1 Tax=Mycolicibacterium litorale TaxID=758802 RepID=A0A6S6P4C6_9MYCO|nr:oxygenase MpaB family protein [Mycolicibacterium litorale]BCI51520.1 hypothetical protein NIIDNTM18_07980 [Mycolicibacterium litorale]
MTGQLETQVELVEPDSVLGRIAGQWTYLPMNGAAFMMQGMHPVIGDVTQKYSVALTDPAGRAIRSLDSVQQWIFGGQAAIEEGNRLRRLHQPLQMRNAEGKHISALNPDAYAWVIATAYVTTVSAAPLLLGRPFTEAELDELWRDSVRVARIVQVPMSHFPQTREEYDVYFKKMVAETLVAHPYILEILGEMRKGQVPPTLPAPVRWAVRKALRPVFTATYLTTIGVMEPEVRDILGITWTDRDQRRLENIWRVIRAAYRILPERLSYTPLAYHARRHHEVIQKMRRRELTSFVAPH